MSIEGHQNCLSSHVSNPEDTHKSVCLPNEQPRNCTTESWQKLTSLGEDGDDEILETCHIQNTNGNNIV